MGNPCAQLCTLGLFGHWKDLTFCTEPEVAWAMPEYCSALCSIKKKKKRKLKKRESSHFGLSLYLSILYKLKFDKINLI